MNQPDNTLQEAISRLPEYDPDAGLWERIAAELDSRQALSGPLKALPEYEPALGSWEGISAQLASAEPPKAVLAGWLRMAASVCLVVVAWAAGRQFFRERETISVVYTREKAPEKVPYREAPDQAGQAAYAFIWSRCQQQLAVCQSPQFRELKAQLDELDAQAEKLRRELDRYGENHDLIRAQIKIENLKSEVTKELIRLLTT